MIKVMVYEIRNNKAVAIGVNELFADEIDTINSGDFGIHAVPLEKWEEVKKVA